MSSNDLISSGVILLSVIAIAYGGTFLLKVTTGVVEANELQQRFFRAGHAHAGVLVILGLVVRLALDVPNVPGWSSAGAEGVLVAAILMPAGFFLSSTGEGRDKPNGLVALVFAGAVVLALGLTCLGLGLLL